MPGIHHRGKGEESRKISLATQYELSNVGSAFERLVVENGSNVVQCRALLQKPVEDRNIEDVHTEAEFFQALQLQVLDTSQSYVFRQGELGDKFYVIFSGIVEVRKTSKSSNGEMVEAAVCELRPGDCFGDRALQGSLNEKHPREASVVTVSGRTELAYMDKLSYSKSAGLEVPKRFRSNKDIVRGIFLQAAHERTERDLKFAVEYLKGVKFFSRFSFEVRKQLCKALRLICAWTNTHIFEEGQPGHHFYIIFSGCVEVLINTTNKYDAVVQTVVSSLKEGETFGELALSEENGLRRATVVATEYTELLTLSRDEYIPLIQKYQNQFHTEYVRMLKQNPYFMGEEWDSHTLEAMCAVMVEKYIPYEGEICKQGSRATEMFIVVRGECVAKYESKDPFTKENITVTLGRYGPNNVLCCAEATAGKFNDVYIRQTSIYAASPVKVLVLSRFDIFHLLSVEARESLQRWSQDEHSESIDSRVMKSIVWEKYRMNYMTQVYEELHITPEHTGNSPKKQLAPLKTINLQNRQVAEPGELHIYTRPKLTFSYSADQLPSRSHRLHTANTTKSTTIPTVSLESVQKLNKARSEILVLDDNGLNASGPLQTLQSLDQETDESGVIHFNPLAGKPPSTSERPARTQSLTSHHTKQFLWTPLHGVYMPYALVGFGRQVDRIGIVAFRVCGKFRERDAALQMFHDICEIEPIQATAMNDHSAFSLYKDGIVAMSLSNMHVDGKHELKGSRLSSKRHSVVIKEARHKKDSLPDGQPIINSIKFSGDQEMLGQRFACIGIKHQGSNDTDEMHVYVYHCFPTYQSAIRHAKQLVSMLSSFADNSLYVVPLFDWIKHGDLERYEARSTELDSLLDGKITISKYSGWKARKEAIRKRQGHLYHRN